MRSGSKAAICIALTVSAVIPWIQGGASACACGEFKGVVVAYGRSLYGVPWRIKAKLVRSSLFDSRAVEVHFSIGRRGDYSGVGYFTGLGLPLHPAFFFTANLGSEINDFPEGDVSGVTRRHVATLVVEMSNGESLTVRPSLAPSSLRERLPWLRGLRFFDAFFPADQEPQLITAFDPGGQVLTRRERHRGFFR
jgi:hypothetical protein